MNLDVRCTAIIAWCVQDQLVCARINHSQPSSNYTHRQFNFSTILPSAHTAYLCVLYGFQNESDFLYTELNVLLKKTGLVFLTAR